MALQLCLRVACAEPFPDLEPFASSYIKTPVKAFLPQDSFLEGTSAKPDAKMESHPSNILALLLELLDQVCSHLPLRTSLALNATCQTLHWRIDSRPAYWYQQLLRLHGDWLWELRDDKIFTGQWDWKALLHRLEKMPVSVFASADIPYGWKYEITPEDRTADFYKKIEFDDKGRRNPPFGLKNRFRIWCCIESVGKGGREINLQGQTSGGPAGCE